MLNTIYRRRISLSRNLLGTSIAELPAGLWIIFVGMGMPLLCLVLTTVRFGFFWEAAREASDAACQAQVYLSTSDGNGGTITGAVSLAQNVAVNVSSMFSGLTIDPDNVNCYIVVTPLSNTAAVANSSNTNSSQASTVVGPNTTLSTPPDITANLYQIRVDVKGKIAPILPLNAKIFGSIPGLTTSFPITMSMMRVFENPQGLYSSTSSSGSGAQGGSGGNGGNSGNSGSSTSGNNGSNSGSGTSGNTGGGAASSYTGS